MLEPQATVREETIVADHGYDNVGDNPTGRPTRSSGRTRRKKERRLFRGTQWEDTAPAPRGNKSDGVRGDDGTVKDSWT
jgi:hypothetical protein